MNKKQIIASLNKIANELDNIALHKEANSVTKVMIKLAQISEDEMYDQLNPQQQTDLQQSKTKEELFRKFNDAMNEILNYHSGFSASFAISQLKQYWFSSPEERPQLKNEIMEKSDDSMYRDILQLIELSENFQQEHGPDDDLMKQFVSALK